MQVSFDAASTALAIAKRLQAAYINERKYPSVTLNRRAKQMTC
jgi:hypothetical protein